MHGSVSVLCLYEEVDLFKPSCRGHDPGWNENVSITEMPRQRVGSLLRFLSGRRLEEEEEPSTGEKGEDESGSLIKVG